MLRREVPLWLWRPFPSEIERQFSSRSDVVWKQTKSGNWSWK